MVSKGVGAPDWTGSTRLDWVHQTGLGPPNWGRCYPKLGPVHPGGLTLISIIMGHNFFVQVRRTNAHPFEPKPAHGNGRLLGPSERRDVACALLAS